MKDVQRSVAQILLLLLSLAGIGIALYLTSVHYEHLPLLCSAHGIVDCQRVTSSPYSVVPGTSLPITVPGLGWAAVSVLFAILGLRASVNYHRLVLAQFLWSLLALMLVLYLVYVEIVLLHTICAWCTGMHVIILAIFLITLVQLLSPSTQTNEQEDEASTLTTTSNLNMNIRK